MPTKTRASKSASRRKKQPSKSSVPLLRGPKQRFQNRLLKWYKEHGRDLPWRKTSDPYHILVSEVMLQQTQVDRVIPKYHEFLERYPSFAELADAPVAEVKQTWYPLGYNIRPEFMHVKGYDSSVYEAINKKLQDQIREVSDLKIIASDISEDAIRISKVNAGIAGVEQLIEFQVCDFELTAIPEAPGVIYFNPEYGERLGEISELETTYARMGDFMKKKCQGYLGYIFTGNLDLAKKIGLKASRRIEFYTSTIDCRLLEYELYGGSRRPPKSVENPQ